MVAASIGAVAGVPPSVAGAQARDSTGMPSLELLATEAGRASRRHPISAVAEALLCDASHPLVDSAAVDACTSLVGARRSQFAAAFARALEVPLVDPAFVNGRSVPPCPPDLEQRADSPGVVVRLTPPIVGEREGRWEGRLAVEFGCYIGGTGAPGDLRVVAKEYLYQWTGSRWRLYQFAWRRTSR